MGWENEKVQSLNKWIKPLNETFKNNRYTDDDRVRIEVLNSETVKITVLNETSILNISVYTEYGVLMHIMIEIDRLYNDGKTIMLSPN